MPQPIAVIDFETTGMAPAQGARATEVAIVLIEGGQVVDRFQSLMRTGAWIPPFITRLTGITNAMVAAAPPAEEVMRDAARFVGSAPMVAHNAAFDSKFWQSELALAGAPMVIAYKIDGLSYLLMKNLVTAKHITLFNIAADEAIAPEFIQHEATPQALAKAVGRLLTDPEAAADQARRQTEALDLMGRGGPDPSELAADAVLRVIAAKAG